MITKEHSGIKSCCFYASEFHLEMILLPYIKQRMDKINFVILTQKNLKDTVEILLERTNLDKKDKEKIISLDWTDNYLEKVLEMKSYLNRNKKLTVFINGDQDYNKYIKDAIDGYKNINIIDCFDISKIDKNIKSVAENYDSILNMNTINE